MRALRACLLGLLFGLLVGAALLLYARLRFPSFLADGGDATTWLFAWTLPTGGLALLLGGLFGRVGTALSCGLAAAVAAGGLAALRAPSPQAGFALAALPAGALVAVALSLERVERRVGAKLLGGAALLLLVGAALIHPPAPKAVDPKRPKILVFGLDAGTWTILNELFSKGELPNLRKLRDDGCSATLKSEEASFSPRVWTTLATGKLPEKHGVVGFESCQNDDLKTRRIWEMLQSPTGGGWSVGLFQWLITWPPDPFEPFIVPAWMARGPQTQPPELSFIKELEIAFQKGEVDGWMEKDRGRALAALRGWFVGYLEHGLRFSTVRRCLDKHFESGRVAEASLAARSGDAAALKTIRDQLQYAERRTIQLWMNGDVYLDLYRRTQPDFSCMILYGTDNLAHKFWQYHFPDDFDLPREQAAPFANALTDYYAAADALLGEIVAQLPPQTTVAVVSDHGFTSQGGGGQRTQREMRPSVSRLVELAKLAGAVTTVEVATHGYVTPLRSNDAGATQAAVDQLVAFLGACVTVDGDKPAFVTKLVASGQLQVDVNLEADLQPQSRVKTPAGELPFLQIASIEDRSGNHSVDGILLLKGPHVRRGRRLEVARLQDVTPTLLYLEGKPVGADMDGMVLYDAIDSDFVDESGRGERIDSWDPLVPIERDKSVVGDPSALRAYLRANGYVK